MQDIFEIEEDAIKPGQRVLIVDDVLATGGTMAAAAQLVQSRGAILVGCFLLMDLVYLKGRERLSGDIPVEALFTYSD